MSKFRGAVAGADAEVRSRLRRVHHLDNGHVPATAVIVERGLENRRRPADHHDFIAASSLPSSASVGPQDGGLRYSGNAAGDDGVAPRI